jgi:hypothetical protein
MSVDQTGKIELVFDAPNEMARYIQSQKDNVTAVNTFLSLIGEDTIEQSEYIRDFEGE